MDEMIDKRFAPKGTIWVCGACGKTATDQYGIEGEHSRGWDESCMLNAILCHEAKGFNDKGEYGWKAMKAYTPVSLDAALATPPAEG